MAKQLRRWLLSVVIVGVVLVVAVGVFVHSGAYDIGADAPHSKIVFTMLDELRDRSIEHHSGVVRPPSNLGDPKRIAAGAVLYNEMCTGCHLGPGVERSELSQGLYPSAPELASGNDLSAAEQFWVIKHGVKLTAMPAWGKTHDDELIWDMVAFIRALPKMNAQQYRSAVANSQVSHHELMEEAQPEKR